MSEKGSVGLNSASKLIRMRPSRKKLSRKSVLKMIAVMESRQSAGTSSNPATTPEPATHSQEFLTSGRTGRRNALPDILGEHALVTSSDLPSRLQSLTTADKSAASTSQGGIESGGGSGGGGQGNS